VAKTKAGAEAGTAADKVALVAHPRAARSIRRLRARAGLLGLVLVTLLSLRAGLPAFDAVLRGLVGGIAAQFVAWAAGVMVWRQLVLGEIIAYRDAQRDAARARAEAAAERAAAARG
jgi:hypothetical protein